MPTELKFGLPDVDLPRLGGGKVSPAAYAGHALVVLFCPHGRAAEAEVLHEYSKAACEFAGYDAWLLAVIEGGASPRVKHECAFATVYDPHGNAWSAFKKLAAPSANLHREKGATFLFARGGSLQTVWDGPVSAGEVVKQLSRRSL